MNTNNKQIKGWGKCVDVSVNETGRQEGGDIKLHNMGELILNYLRSHEAIWKIISNQ